MLCDVNYVGTWSEIPNKQSQLVPPFHVSCIQNIYHEHSAKPHNTHPLTVIGWNTIYFGFEVLVVPFIFLYDLWA